MAWDSKRAVPWRRLIKEWLIYAVVFSVVVLFVRRNDLRVEDFAWIVFTLPVWLGVSALLAKAGYQRKTLKEIRAEANARAAQEQRATERGGAATAAPARSRPAPTRRTSGGPNRPSKPKRR